jgi:hypothetical protein
MEGLRVRQYGFLLVGLLLGCAHFWLALKAMFVFRNDEPATMWYLIISGPLSTLPAVILAHFWPKVGGTWLVLASIVSLSFAIISAQTNRDAHQVAWYFAAYSAPMFLLGLAALLRADPNQ